MNYGNITKISDSATILNPCFSRDDLHCRRATGHSTESNRNECMEWTGTTEFEQRCGDMVSCKGTLWI